ncbi:tripartite tricarboxylate transporter permease [Pseudonocardia sp. MH-G8]|uniref:tripartite tricarboxylate transporter permease n=1 Tax=Pseudonocardia sp. MH-G8 TaxID=1854588 RepID=UPI000B9FD146|nr:tripartite tricarboxylate transporter permease [Pseudonocardia sp. MH-G8]OZM79562.1 hypothetical protein CFP66_25735 [Pseudonocardia sp. MH-G8]
MISTILVALGMGLLGAVVFSAIGLVSGTDETATLAPLTLLVVLVGVPAPGVLAFFLAGAVSKHMTHMIPTALLGIPGDTMAVPLLREANLLRRLGVPHIALHKAISGAAIAAFIAVPVAVGAAALIAPFADQVTAVAPYVFPAAAALIAYFSRGRWAAVAGLVPMVLVIAALQAFVTPLNGSSLSISFFLGIAIGPLVADLFRLSSPFARESMREQTRRTFFLAPDVKSWKGWFPNPLKVLDRSQKTTTGASAVVSSLTFVLSPVAMTVVLGEAVGARTKHAYHRLTTMMAVKNGVTESTYIAETLIPLVAIGLPLSPVAAGPAAPLFNAPPVYTIDAASGESHNLHDLLSPWEFLGYGMLAVLLGVVVAYPFSMNYARTAAAWVVRRLSQEAVIGTFAGLILVISVYEGGILGLLVAVTVGIFGGLMNKLLGMHAGVQFMAYYTAALFVPTLLG